MCGATHITNVHDPNNTQHNNRPAPAENIILILATRDTQFGQELAFVMQTTHAQRWQYPNVDLRLFSSIENVHRYYKNPWVWV